MASITAVLNLSMPAQNLDVSTLSSAVSRFIGSCARSSMRSS
ncbi:hypothetical protein [Streptomyces sp. NPDC056663]